MQIEELQREIKALEEDITGKLNTLAMCYNVSIDEIYIAKTLVIETLDTRPRNMVSEVRVKVTV
jgi:hypothetical protein